MSSVLSEKVKSIRTTENLTQQEFGDLTGISISTIKKYETGVLEPGGTTLLRVTSHERFKKYTMWLMTGDIAPEIGQISPALSPDGSEGTLSHQKGQKAG